MLYINMYIDKCLYFESFVHGNVFWGFQYFYLVKALNYFLCTDNKLFLTTMIRILIKKKENIMFHFLSKKHANKNLYFITRV